MRILLIASSNSSAEAVASRLATSRGLPLVSLGERLQDHGGKPSPTLGQELKQKGLVLQEGPKTPEQAAGLDALLETLDSPLDLVIAVDGTREDPSEPSPETDPLLDYYKERGLLRRIRCEGEASDLLAAAERITDDVARARHPDAEDPFAAALRLIARGTPQAAENPGKWSHSVETAANSRGESTKTQPSGPSWKRTTAKKGRLQGRDTARRKPRR